MYRKRKTLSFSSKTPEMPLNLVGIWSVSSYHVFLPSPIINLVSFSSVKNYRISETIFKAFLKVEDWDGMTFFFCNYCKLVPLWLQIVTQMWSWLIPSSAFSFCSICHLFCALARQRGLAVACLADQRKGLGSILDYAARPRQNFGRLPH